MFPGKFDGAVSVGKSEFKVSGIMGAEGTDGWYQRVENNGWRAVTIRAQHELSDDSVEKDTHRAKQHFHFSKLVRKEDKEKIKKKKKREWLRKMYNCGLAQEKEKGTIDLCDQRATMQTMMLMEGGGEGEDFMEDMENAGENAFLEFDEEGGGVDVEVENLFSWTDDLDYDGYLNNWSSIGTSAGTGMAQAECK